jgi:hypothetical protein
MESLPSTYAGKGEIAIRDHLISVLRSHFEHVCAERFNKGGKTDIFVEEQGKTVLIAECKIWDGSKSYSDAIDQLLGYLRWDDAQAAVFMFVRTKHMGSVIEQIGSATPRHGAFVAASDSEHRGWYNFDFRLNNDPAQPVRIAVLCFHFPGE